MVTNDGHVAMTAGPGHPWDNLDPKIRTLIWTKTFPGSTYLAGTVVLTTAGGDRRGAASGFLIQVGPLPPIGNPEFFLITARHVVLDAKAFKLQLEALVIHGYDSRKPVQDRVRIPLDMKLWDCNHDSDVAMMPFPVAALPADHNLCAIPDTELMSRKMSVLLPHGAELSAYGRWSVQGGADIPIERKVTLASFERPSAALEIGRARQSVRVYLAEGTVSRGMSGGPVTYAASGWGGSGVLGLIHGYWPLTPEDVLPAGADQEALDRATVWNEVRQGIAAVNSGIFYVVPIQDVEVLLTRAGHPYLPPATN